MTDKPSRNEAEYFARREAELRDERMADAARARADAERRSHFMKCPKCGADLAIETYQGVEIDRCPDCSGIWFDAGEAQLMMEKESAGVGKIFQAVVRGLSGKPPKN